MTCMNFTSKGTREILVAGCQNQMFKVDVEKGIITHTVGLMSRLDILANVRSSPRKLNIPS
jgi:PAB-dependent poly(A)-specific ribonuclease subunit 2